MFNIHNELLENIDSDKLLPIDNDTFEVTNLIKVYDLEIDSSLINTIESQYIVITDFIIGLYLEKQTLPLDLKEFIQNSYNYRIFLLENIKDRMKNIIKESSIYLFKEIYIILNLLSNGNKYDLLTDQNMFSIEQLHLLLNDYEDMVCELFIKEDKNNFTLSFSYYLTLLEVLNGICVINSLDIQRRKNINGILELITNTITNIKSKLQLEENDIKALNAVLGKLLLYFTNMTYIAIDSNNKDIVIQKYAFMLKKIYDGFKLLNNDEKYYLSFLDKVTTLILTLIYKLKTKLHIQNIEFSESKNLEEIYSLYNKSVKKIQNIEVSNLNDFREKLLQNYKYLYTNSTNRKLDKHDGLINFFISLDEISNVDMIIIHNIVLYSQSIEKTKLDLLVKSLLEKNKFDNDYYEFYKLRIIDRILQKYISLKVKTSDNIYIDQIIKYIEKNNLVSHLMSMYAKIYLSLSLYYSYEKTEASQEKSKEFYFIYQRLDNNNFLEKEFRNISKQIIHNYAVSYFKQFEFKTKAKFLNIELLEIGKDLIDKSIKIKELETKNQSLTYIENLVKDILQINEPNDVWLNKKIEKLIAEKLFLGLAKVKIEIADEKQNILEVGYDSHRINIDNGYSLVLYYSSYYKTSFEKILNKNKEFIQLNIKNIFKTYLNSIPSYTDVITKLPNINKLKNDLKKLENQEVIFLEIYLDSLVDFSKSNNINKSNKFFKAITSKINEEVESYRLFGPKIGILLNKDKNYKDIVEYLQNLKIEFENEEKNLESVIAVSIGRADKILEKSFYALSSAKLSDKKLYIFE